MYYEDAPAKVVKPSENKDKPVDGKEEPVQTPPEKVKKERSTLCLIKVFENFYGLPQNVLDVNI